MGTYPTSTAIERQFGMSAEVFHPSYHCPLCRNRVDRAADRQPLDFSQGQLSLNPALPPASLGWLKGQLRCPYCKSNFVATGQGQFVRDPFRTAPRLSIQQLRRQSRPLARLRRDLQPALWAFAGAIAVLVIGGMTYEGTRDHASPQGMTTPAESVRP
jgi:hypothetical protein